VSEKMCGLRVSGRMSEHNYMLCSPCLSLEAVWWAHS
jgi:hypothetical protein